MASVRLSNELRDIICRNAQNAFEISAPEPEYATPDLELISAAFSTSNAQKTLDKIAKMFEEIPTVKKVYSYSRQDTRMASFGARKPVRNKVTRLHVEMKGESSESRDLYVIPLNRGVDMYADSEDPRVHIDVIDDAITREKVREIMKSHEKAVEDRRDKFYEYRRQVRHLVDSCTTLKQFLTAWPAGEAFVPQHKINEMHTKVTRIQKAKTIKEEIQFDDTAVNQVVLTAKLMGQ